MKWEDATKNPDEVVAIKRFLFDPDNEKKETHKWISIKDYKAAEAKNDTYLTSTIRGAREEYELCNTLEDRVRELRPESVDSFMRSLGSNIPSEDASRKLLFEEKSENEDEILYVVLADAGKPLRRQLQSITVDDFFGIVHQMLIAFEVMHTSRKVDDKVPSNCGQDGNGSPEQARLGYVHHDFKIDNVMYHQETNRVVIIDFGSMTHPFLPKEEEDEKIAMTPTFIPYEYYFPDVKGEHDSFEKQYAFDMFNLACMIGECFCYLSPMRDFVVGEHWRHTDYMNWDKWHQTIFRDPEHCRDPNVSEFNRIMEETITYISDEKHKPKFAPELFRDVGKSHKYHDFVHDWIMLFTKDPMERVKNARMMQAKLATLGHSMSLPVRKQKFLLKAHKCSIKHRVEVTPEPKEEKAISEQTMVGLCILCCAVVCVYLRRRRVKRPVRHEFMTVV
jgi:serine/threonine protein kinase